MAKEDYKGIWIFAEQQNGVLNPVTLELLAKAQELKAHNGEDIYAILLGSDVKALAPTLIAHGADKVIVAEDAALASYSARPYQQAMTQLAEKYKPSIILYGATSLGRDFAPRVMVSLKTGLTADAIDLGYDEDDVFYQTTHQRICQRRCRGLLRGYRKHPEGQRPRAYRQGFPARLRRTRHKERRGS